MNKLHEWLSHFAYSPRHPAVRWGVRACLISAVLALAALGFWWPAEQKFLKLSDQITQYRRNLVQAQQADELLQAYAIAQKDVPVFEKKLEQAASQAQLVENFGRLGTQYGVRLLGETYEERKDANGRALLVAELTVQGAYPAMRNFLQGLPSLPTWTEVRDIRLESQRELKIIKGRILVITYRQLLEAKR